TLRLCAFARKSPPRLKMSHEIFCTSYLLSLLRRGKYLDRAPPKSCSKFADHLILHLSSRFTKAAIGRGFRRHNSIDQQFAHWHFQLFERLRQIEKLKVPMRKLLINGVVPSE